MNCKKSFISILSIVFLLLIFSACSGSYSNPGVRVVEVTREVFIEMTSTPAPQVEEPVEELVEEPVEELIPPERIICFCNRDYVTQLSGLAFANSITFTNHGVDDFLIALRESDVVAAIYVDEKARPEILLHLSEFVEKGGRALIFYNDRWSSENELLQELFKISIAREIVIGTDDIVIFNDNKLPKWLSGLRIAVPANHSKGARVSAYLVSQGDIGEAVFINSEETGKERLVYLNRPNKSVTFFPTVQNSSEYYWDLYFWGDKNIDLADNEQAALAMLDYLLSP